MTIVIAVLADNDLHKRANTKRQAHSSRFEYMNREFAASIVAQEENCKKEKECTTQ